MVAKISVGSSLYGALSYNNEKVEEGEAKVLLTNLIRQQEDGEFTMSQCLTDFMACMPSHFRTKKPVIHISLNPHPEDKLTDLQLSEIAEKYLEKLGYGNQPYMVFKHEDIEREHIHIVSLRVNSEGKKINDRYEYRRSKSITNELEIEYGLLSSNKAEQKRNFHISPIDAEKGDLKKQISNILKSIGKDYSFLSIGEYRTLLSLYNIGVEEVKGERKGEPYNGLIYTVLDKEGNAVSNPLKSSLFGKPYGYDGIGKKTFFSKENIRKTKARENTRFAVSTGMVKTDNEQDFIKYLADRNIDAILRKNENGRITGATFISHTEKVVFNGSRLGKDYSANAFNDLFGVQPEPVKKNHINEPTSNNSLVTIISGNNTIHDDTTPDNPFPKKKKKKRTWGFQD